MLKNIRHWSRRHLGTLIIAGAALHSTIGLTSTEGSFADLIRSGWFGSMNPGYEPVFGETFWFTFTGLALLSSGFLVRSHLRATGSLPASFGWSLIVIALLIGTAMPASGAWLIFAIGLLALATSQPAEPEGLSPGMSTPRTDQRISGLASDDQLVEVGLANARTGQPVDLLTDAREQDHPAIVIQQPVPRVR